MNYVLLTRTIDENLKLSQEIEPKGIITISCPMLYLSEISIDWNVVKKYSHLIVTSKFSAQIIAKNTKHNIKALVVGVGSAQILEQNSNICVTEIFSNAASLATYLMQNSATIKGAYICGNITKINMPDFVDSYLVYNTTYTSKISDILKKQIINMEIKAVMLYSENSAKIFIDLCNKNSIISYLSTVTAIVISKNVKDIVSKYFKETFFCDKPDNKLMLKLLYNIYGKNF